MLHSCLQVILQVDFTFLYSAFMALYALPLLEQLFHTHADMS